MPRFAVSQAAAQELLPACRLLFAARAEHSRDRLLSDRDASGLFVACGGGRLCGAALVQVEWAPPSVWETASKMATAVAPVARTARMVTGQDTDYTASISLDGAVPATLYRYHVLVSRIGESAAAGPATVGAAQPGAPLVAHSALLRRPRDVPVRDGVTARPTG